MFVLFRFRPLQTQVFHNNPGAHLSNRELLTQAIDYQAVKYTTNLFMSPNVH